MFLFLFLLPVCAQAIGPNLFEGDLFDFAIGPGYVAGDNIRRHNSLSGQQKAYVNGIEALYGIRLGPFNISNAYEILEFTRVKGARAGAVLTVKGDRYQGPGTAERKQSIFAGGYLGYKALTLFTQADVNSKSSGVIYTIAYTPLIFSEGKHLFYLIANLENMNHNYVAYYFGIRPEEASALLPQYDGKHSNNVSARVLYTYKFTRYAGFVAWAGEKYWGKGVTRSPTVGKKFEFNSGFGFLFGLL